MKAKINENHYLEITPETHAEEMALTFLLDKNPPFHLCPCGREKVTGIIINTKIEEEEDEE